MKVRTQYGLSAEKKFKKLVLQGDTWGPIMASNQVDSNTLEIISIKNLNISFTTKVTFPFPFPFAAILHPLGAKVFKSDTTSFHYFSPRILTI